MIESFTYKGLEELFEKGKSAKVQASLADRISRRLDAIDTAKTPEALNISGFDSPSAWQAESIQHPCKWAVVHHLRMGRRKRASGQSEKLSLIQQPTIPPSNPKTAAKRVVTGGIMRTRKPTHPGAILREDVLPQLNMSVSAFSRSLGVSRQTLHAVLAERSGISPKMALRLGALLGNGAQLWLCVIIFLMCSTAMNAL